MKRPLIRQQTARGGFNGPGKRAAVYAAYVADFPASDFHPLVARAGDASRCWLPGAPTGWKQVLDSVLSWKARVKRGAAGQYKTPAANEDTRAFIQKCREHSISRWNGPRGNAASAPVPSL
jgi:hypothetical protein